MCDDDDDDAQAAAAADEMLPAVIASTDAAVLLLIGGRPSTEKTLASSSVIACRSTNRARATSFSRMSSSHTKVIGSRSRSQQHKSLSVSPAAGRLPSIEKQSCVLVIVREE